MASTSSCTVLEKPRSQFVELVQTIQGKWDVTNFFKPEIVSNVATASSRPYVFSIGAPDNEKPTHENSVKAEAFLSGSHGANGHISITFSILERIVHPGWKVTAEVEELQICDGVSVLNNIKCRDYFVQQDLMQDNIVGVIVRGLPGRFRTATRINFRLRCIIIRPELTKGPTNVLELYGSHVLRDYEAILNDSTTADVEIKVLQEPRKSFHCHKFVLSVRCPVFRAMFQAPMMEANANIVEVEDISADVMSHFISFLYCGHFQDSSWVASLPGLVNAADKYCVESLRELCNTNLIRSVTCGNALAIASLAGRHKLSTAVSDIRKFIAQNAGKLSIEGCEDTKLPHT